MENLNRVFTEKDGFQIAVAVPDFTVELTDEWYQDHYNRKLEEWITLQASHIKCTLEEGCEYTNLELHKCTEEELGLEDRFCV